MAKGKYRINITKTIKKAQEAHDNEYTETAVQILVRTFGMNINEALEILQGKVEWKVMLDEDTQA